MKEKSFKMFYKISKFLYIFNFENIILGVFRVESYKFFKGIYNVSFVVFEIYIERFL